MANDIRHFLRYGDQASLDAYRDRLAREIASRRRCEACGAQLTGADTIPCKFDYPGYRCGVESR